MEEDDLLEDLKPCQVQPAEDTEDEDVLFRDSWEDEDGEFYDQGVEDARYQLIQLPAVQMIQCAAVDTREMT